MSFSQKAKNEMARIEIEKSCCKRALLAAFIAINGEALYAGKNKLNLKLTFENPGVARVVFKLIKEVFQIHPEIKVRKNSNFKKSSNYQMVMTHGMGSRRLVDELGLLDQEQGLDLFRRFPREHILEKRCCKRAYLRGAFLSGGSVTAPEKTYHLEFVTDGFDIAVKIQELINSFGLNAKIVPRKRYHIVYLKEGDQIVDLLNIMGAHSALMDLENTRILKEMRNNINRIVNCETANLSKTVNASVKQLEAIDKIRRTMGLQELPEHLQQLAELRIKHEDASFKELGEMMDPPVGKSGVNHRFRKLEKIANSIG